VAALAAALLTLTAGTAEAKVPRVFFGAEANPSNVEPLTDADFARARSARLGTMRLTFNWAAIEPTAGAPRDWSYYDGVLSQAARARLSIMAVLVGSPSFAASDGAYAPATPAGREAYRVFVRDVVQRYGRGGTFWEENRELPRKPVTAYQVWNEPNYPPHWGEGASVAAEYAALLRPVARTIRRNDRKATIATAGLLASSTRGPTGYRYLRALYRVPGIKRYFDTVSIHPYAEDARGVEGELMRIRQVMNRAGDRRSAIWITELGWSTGGANEYFTKTPARQASLLRSSFRLVVKTRKRYRVSRLIWFSWRDRPPSADQGWEFYCGLFDITGQPKPAWTAFRRFTRATG